MASGVSIREEMRSIIGETYDLLTERAAEKYDGDARPDIFNDAIEMAMEELFVPNTNESQITSRFVARYVAKTAAREVIPAAIDYIMHKTGLSDSTGPNPATAGATSIRNETRQHYNRVQTLERLDDRLAKQLAVDRPRFEAMAGSLVLVSVAGTDAMIGPRVSGMGTPLLTSDPAIIGPPNDCYGTPGWYAGLGVVH